jgi:hypothetical protein
MVLTQANPRTQERAFGTTASFHYRIWIVSSRRNLHDGLMKFTKNIGMFLLAIYLIIDGLLGFGLHLGPAIFLLYLIALAAGIFILIGK